MIVVRLVRRWNTLHYDVIEPLVFIFVNNNGFYINYSNLVTIIIYLLWNIENHNKLQFRGDHTFFGHDLLKILKV